MGARVESEGEDVTPTAVAKEVIGLRPCARYSNRGRGESAEGYRRDIAEGADARVSRWTRTATIGGDRPMQPRFLVLHQFVEVSPSAGVPLPYYGEDRARGM